MFRKTIIATACALILAPSISRADEHMRGTEGPPNIIFIMADDLGYGDTEPYGQRFVSMPNLMRLAAEGARFTDFYSGSTVCSPARASLMSGRHGGHLTTQENTSGHLLIRPDDEFLSTRLKKLGYRTAMIGKWALGDVGTPGEPSRQGFDHYFGFLDQSKAHRHYPKSMIQNGKEVSYPGNHDSDGDSYANDLFVKEAISFIKKSDQPFFLYLALTLPHADILAPSMRMAKYRGKFLETPFPGNHYSAQPEPSAALAAMLEMIDDTVGQIMLALERSGRDHNTLIMFTSDNGPVDVAGRDTKLFDATAGLRGLKRDLYEGGIRVPMIVRWPAKIAPSQEISLPSYFPDIMPTLLEAAKTESPSLDGMSMLGALTGSSQPPQERAMYWAHRGRPFIGTDPADPAAWGKERFLEAVRLGRWKAIRIDRSAVELYDLVEDPKETKDLAAARPDLVSKLTDIMEKEFRPGN